MYGRILVAVDGSEISRLALGEAVKLAGMLNAKLCIAHGIDAVTANAYKSADRDQFLATHIETGRAILQKAAAVAQDAGIQWEERLLEIDTIGRSRLPEAIVRDAEAWAADLILVGTHGRRGVSHLLLGSVAEGIVHIAPKPVLVVPNKAVSGTAGPEKSYENLLVAVDGTETSEPALQEAIRFAQLLKLTLRVVHVVNASEQDAAAAGAHPRRAEDILGAAQAKAREAGISAETRTLEASRQASAIAEAVTADATTWPAQLIVLGTHGRRGLDRLRLGSVAEAILRLAPAPVLLFRANTGSPAD